MPGVPPPLNLAASIPEAQVTRPCPACDGAASCLHSGIPTSRLLARTTEPLVYLGRGLGEQVTAMAGPLP